MTNKKLAFAISMLLVVGLTAFSAGCILDDILDELTGDELEVGDTWTYEMTEDGNVSTLTVEVISTDVTYNGMEMNEFTFEFDNFFFDDYELNMEGTAKGDSWQHLHYMEYSAQGDIEDPWMGNGTFLMETSMEMEYSGDEMPDDYEVGDTWTIEEYGIMKTEITFNGEPYFNDTNHDNKTTEYEVLAEEEVTVPAGTFDCYKIKRVDQESGDYDIAYFSSDAKGFVKISEYKNTGELITEYELSDYSV